MDAPAKTHDKPPNSAPTSPLAVGTRQSGAPFELSAGTITEASAVFGRRGTGKTYTASVVVEEVLSGGQQVIVLDPTDAWWGIKISADGASRGFPVPVLGGPHGDLPLDEAAAGPLADFAVDTRASMILSLRHLKKPARTRFVTRFNNQLYHRKGALAHRTPVLVVYDEARLFAPQKPGPKDGEMLDSMDDVVRLGRASGLGAMLVDQRPASVNKDVLSQLEVLVCHRIVSPHDRRAIDDWIRQHDTEDRRSEFLAALASLPRGEAWFWLPARDVLERVRVRERATYDSSQTPELGDVQAVPAKLAWADADTEALREALRGALLAGQEARPHDDDPEALRRRIRDLEEILARREPAPPDPEAVEAEVERAAAPLRARISSLEAALAGVSAALRRTADEARSALDSDIPQGQAPAPDSHAEDVSAVAATDRTPASPDDSGPDPADVVPFPVQGGPNPVDLTPAELGILEEIERLRTLGVKTVDRRNLAVLAGRSPKSSSFEAQISGLRGRGLISYPAPGRLGITDAGRTLARTSLGWHTNPPPHEDGGPARLHGAWISYLPGARGRILRALLDRHPGSLRREELASLVGQSPRSSSFEEHVRVLRALGVAEYPEPGAVRAAPLLFPAGRP